MKRTAISRTSFEREFAQNVRSEPGMYNTATLHQHYIFNLPSADETL